MKTSNEAILYTLTSAPEQGYSSNSNDDQLPDAIDPVVVRIANNNTTEDEADRWATSFLEYGADLLGDAITIVKETRNPRAVEVASRLLKDLFDSAVKLKEVKKKEKEIEKSESVDNDNIKMTPSQLLQMIKANAEGGN